VIESCVFAPRSQVKSSTATTWALFALSQNPEVQTKLRDELLKVSTDNPSMDELSALSYLDIVVRETLRVHSPVPSTMRVAMEDDVIPLNTPFVDKNGQIQHGIKYVTITFSFSYCAHHGLFFRVSKGDRIFVPILAINRAKHIWGEDAAIFRWMSSSSA
jgi:Cytochrome P450